MMKTVKVYSTPTCPWCIRAKDFLKQQKVAFEDINVAVDVKARDEMVKKSGQLGVPVLEIDGTIILGFDQQAIQKALKA